jgi:hypothetical protein
MAIIVSSLAYYNLQNGKLSAYPVPDLRAKQPKRWSTAFDTYSCQMVHPKPALIAMMGIIQENEKNPIISFHRLSRFEHSTNRICTGI